MKDGALELLQNHPVALGLIGAVALIAVAWISTRIAPTAVTWCARGLLVVWVIVFGYATLTPEGGLLSPDFPRLLNLVPGRGLGQVFQASDQFQRDHNFGLILTVAPLGVLAPLAARFSIRQVAVAALGTSLLVETIQWALRTGRIADINDVILEVSAAVAAAALFEFLRRRLEPRAIPGGAASAAA